MISPGGRERERANYDITLSLAKSKYSASDRVKSSVADEIIDRIQCLNVDAIASVSNYFK